MTATTAMNDHRVEFFDSDCALAEAVASYLRPAGCAVVVASAAHRRALTRRLGRTVGGQRLVMVDVDAVLRLLLGETGEAPLVPEAFERVIGGLLRRANHAGGPVRVYGEASAVLWQRGEIDTALRLEALSTELGAGRTFGLMCGYPSWLFAAAGTREAFQQVCGEHHAVTTPVGRHLPRWAQDAARGRSAHGVRWRLPAALSSGGAARRHLRELLHAWELHDLRDVAELLLTELVSNAVLHAGSPVVVHASHRQGVLRLEVDDLAPGRLEHSQPGLDDISGRGVMLVEALSSAWGTATDAGGKTVWFELDSLSAQGRSPHAVRA